MNTTGFATEISPFLPTSFAHQVTYAVVTPMVRSATAAALKCTMVMKKRRIGKSDFPFTKSESAEGAMDMASAAARRYHVSSAKNLAHFIRTMLLRQEDPAPNEKVQPADLLIRDSRGDWIKLYGVGSTSMPNLLMNLTQC
jgi:hypothetical protein